MEISRAHNVHPSAPDSDEEEEIYAYRTRSQHPPSANDGHDANDIDARFTPSHSYLVGGEEDGNAEPAQTPETETEASTPSEGTTLREELEQQKTPFYGYATEKMDSQADAKLFYQRHRLDTKSGEGDAPRPALLAKSTTMPASFFEMDAAAALDRTPSLTSRSSHRRMTGLGLAGLHSQAGHAQEPFPAADQASPDIFLAADAAARAHAAHPALPHEYKDSLLSNQGMHGAGAGVGVGSGAGGFANPEVSIVTEVEAICTKIKTVLDFRRKYLRISLQCPGDNPKDDESWEIYPAPPEPVWGDDKARPPPPPHSNNGVSSMSNSLYMADSGAESSTSAKLLAHVNPDFGAAAADPHTPTSPHRKRRKAGQAIGEDFDMSDCTIPGRTNMTFALDEGSVYQVFEPQSSGSTPIPPITLIPTLREYYMALDAIQDIASDGPAKSFAYRRLQYLEGRYNLYTLLNEYEEIADTKKVPHRDFYNVRKVDTHVHHSACMNQKHLLRFIKSKMKRCPDEKVIFREGKELSLREVFESINLTAYDLSIDTLDMHAHTDSFHRFDKFNLKYNPIGHSRLREIFLKTDNFIQGRYLADITREVISDLESSKYQMVEWRISIYGRNLQEWDKLAAWVVDNKLFSPNVRWLIQVPRLYDMYKASKMMENFEAVIKNVFQPLFEVTQDPSSHPKLHVFLQRVIGLDSVDDESKVERRFFRKYPTPKEWNTKQNPPYNYWIYFLFANMTSLNAFRKRRGFNTFLLRPHCGEAGDTDHLAAAILCCHSISHGILLRKVPILQYVFYLDQIGIAMSPLSNNALFLTYDRNPFVSYFRKGLNVSLSTDDPLQFAFTKEPLIEEYSVAAQIYKFSAVDMCELAKHSVDQSGFELSLKQRWLGKCCYLPGVLGNDVAKCNVPDVREAFRHETLKAEHSFIAKFTADYSHLEKCNPGLPEAVNSETPIEAVFGSPRQYYAKVADTMPVAQAAGIPMSRSNIELPHLQTSPEHERVGSRSSTMLWSAVKENAGYVSISGAQPRIFPGVVHDRERKRSVRKSTSGSESAAEASSGAFLEPGLAKMSVKEREEVEAVENELQDESE